MNVKKILMMAVVASALAARTASVYADVGQLELGVAPGFSIPLSSNLDEYDNSLHLEGFGLYHLDRGVAVGAQLGYTFDHELDSDVLGTSQEAELKVLHLTPTVRFSGAFSSENRAIQPYAILGAGFYQTQTEATARVNGVVVGETSQDETDLGLNIGVGAGVTFNESFHITGDLRYHQIFDSGQDPKFLVPTVRLSILY